MRKLLTLIIKNKYDKIIYAISAKFVIEEKYILDDIKFDFSFNNNLIF